MTEPLVPGASPDPSSSPNLPAPLILVVDDDPFIPEIVGPMLAREQYRLAFAADGREGLQLAAETPPDLMLVDLMMPFVDGLGVSRAMRADPARRHIPIIMMSVYNDRANLVTALENGVDEFISKPLAGDELRARVRTMLRIKRQFDELTRLIQQRQKFTRMLIHDFRSPLTVISSGCDLLRISGGLREEQLRWLTGIASSSERLSSYTDQVLLMAASESGGLTPERGPVQLPDLLAKVMEGLAPAAARRNVTVALECPEESPDVLVDTPLMYRAVENLIGNAIEFSPAHAEISVRCHSEMAGERRIASVRVADLGPGIREEFREHVFDEFAVGERRATGKFRIGLGLAFCRMVAELHRGGIDLKPNQPTGSIFTMHWPAG